MSICGLKKIMGWSVALLLIVIYSFTAPKNHSEAEDVYQFAKVVEQGTFADQAGVNRVLALPIFGAAYKGAQWLGYSGRAFPFMIFINRLLAVVCLVLFYDVLSLMYRRRPACPSSSVPHLPVFQSLMPNALLLAFSYGFWRYANEAETYILASVFVLGAWCLVAKGRWLMAISCSAIGILVHLLNLIPLLFIIPLYYLLSKEWQKAVLHGGLTGVLVTVGYGICFHSLDWSELGARHHLGEAGVGFENLLRGGTAFGQCLVSGNFLFGFESFRDLLVKFFPSRMLGEEFFMATQMSRWIPWVGCLTLGMLGCWGVWILGMGGRNVADVSCFVAEEEREPQTPSLKPNAFFISCMVWLILYALAILRTESGSPELWIMALIPFWFIFGRWIKGRWVWGLVILLFVHNLIAGLLPVMSEKSDYHATKGKWLVENGKRDDLILMSYEPILIFYLNYYSVARVVNSGEWDLEEIEALLDNHGKTAYAFFSFFKPLESMQVRSPAQYEKMLETGQALCLGFEKRVDDEFGGIYKLKEE